MWSHVSTIGVPLLYPAPMTPQYILTGYTFWFVFPMIYLCTDGAPSWSTVGPISSTVCVQHVFDLFLQFCMFIFGACWIWYMYRYIQPLWYQHQFLSNILGSILRFLRSFEKLSNISQVWIFSDVTPDATPVKWWLIGSGSLCSFWQVTSKPENVIHFLRIPMSSLAIFTIVLGGSWFLQFVF